MVEITATGKVREILEQMGGLTSKEIMLLSGLGEQSVWKGLRILFKNDQIQRELIICEKKTRGSPPYLWSIKK